jgi:hypothetical protein
LFRVAKGTKSEEDRNDVALPDATPIDPQKLRLGNEKFGRDRLAIEII